MGYSINDFRRDIREPFAFPGGYAKVFFMADGEALSHAGAKQNIREILSALAHGGAAEWTVDHVDANWEDIDLHCAHTGERIPSEYAEDEYNELHFLDGADLFLDDHRGIYIPRDFANCIKDGCHNISAEDLDVLKAGPDHEQYWDTWTDVLDHAVITDEHGKTFTLYQDGALWLVPNKD